MRFRPLDSMVCLAVLPILVAGCGGDHDASGAGAGAGGGSTVTTGSGGGGGAAPADIAFGPFGSTSDPSGKGSFRFGASSAATQIEDQNPDTDWYVWTLPTDQGGLGMGTFVGDASKGYTLATEDVDLLAAMNVDSYRFSMEWAR